MYREVQKFEKSYVLVFLIASGVFTLYVFIQQFFLGIPLDWPVWITVLIFVSLPIFLWKARLVIEVNQDIKIKHSWIFTCTIPLQNVVKAYVRTYKPILDYWGWGVKWTPWKGWAYTIRGNKGVQLELVNGKKLLIGSQQPEKLLESIK